MCLCTRSYLSTSQQDIAVLFYIAFIDLFLQEQATLNRSKHCFCIVFACWALYCRSELASVDSFVVSTDRRDLFMPLILYAASLKARAQTTETAQLLTGYHTARPLYTVLNGSSLPLISLSLLLWNLSLCTLLTVFMLGFLLVLWICNFSEGMFCSVNMSLSFAVRLKAFSQSCI